MSSARAVSRHRSRRANNPGTSPENGRGVGAKRKALQPHSSRPDHVWLSSAADSSSVFGAHRMELDPVDEGVLVDRPRVRGAASQGLAVGLAGAPDVRLGDRSERNELDGVDLDQTRADPVAATLLDLWPLPQPDRQRDIAGQDVIAQLTTELHAPDASW
jgi:hypothetical protein